MAAKNNDQVTTASVLAFERKLDPSDGLFYSGKWDDRENGADWPGLKVREKSVRGTISNRLSTKDQDPAKLDSKIESPNLQTVDVVTMPVYADTLRVRYTLKVLGDAGKPSACNNHAYQDKLGAIVQGYVDAHGFGELAKRYAENLANGRVLWRNRLGAENIETIVCQIKDGKTQAEWKFDSHDFSLRNFPSNDTTAIKELSKVIDQGLSGQGYTLLEIVSYVRVGEGQEVFPSQELILDRGKAKGGKSKTLYVSEAVAAMHSQKVGNAVRTIDTWYPEYDEAGVGPIAVEPYGSVTSLGSAFRQPKAKADFYNLLDNWVTKDREPETEQQHFVMAIFIRGGVFGKAE